MGALGVRLGALKANLGVLERNRVANHLERVLKNLKADGAFLCWGELMRQPHSTLRATPGMQPGYLCSSMR